MSTNQLFIPEKIKVGFQKRDGTYTGKLAYVIYYKDKILRKEKSWEGWRDKKIAAQEFDNEPTEGFVLNKGVGGARHSYGWNPRNEYIRVYDPRDFEFEISVPNLLFILRECDCSRGKGLEGKFVYAWDRDSLVLVPVNSQDYQNSKQFTDLQAKAVKAKELVPGFTYVTRKQEELTYLGKLDFYFIPCETHHYDSVGREWINDIPSKDVKGVEKKFVFWDGKDFKYLNAVSNIATVKSDATHPDFADLVEKYNKGPHGSRLVKLYLEELSETVHPGEGHYYRQSHEGWFYEEPVGEFVECHTTMKYEYDQVRRENIETAEVQYIRTYHRYLMKDGICIRKDYCTTAYPDNRPRNDGYVCVKYREPTRMRLFAETANGGKHRVNMKNFGKE